MLVRRKVVLQPESEDCEKVHSRASEGVADRSNAPDGVLLALLQSALDRIGIPIVIESFA